jgi:rhodanese-related sulfurtransferase
MMNRLPFDRPARCPRRALLAGLLATAALMGGAGPWGIAAAEEEDPGFIPLVEGKPFLHVLADGESIKVERIQDPSYELTGYFAKTARKCPPFCIHPMDAAPGVKTVGEVELFNFMEGPVRDGTGILVDARTPQWFEKGTIPGAVNIPFTAFPKDPRAPEWAKLMERLGAKPRGEIGQVERTLEEWGLADNALKTAQWDFTGAKDLVLFCNGPACDQSPRAIVALRGAGYPAQKLFYYRGGMQLWQLWGLTTYVPKK